ncbi:MAG: HD-GYP domain-containing protein [Cellulosilyticaceae bacterium]
MREKTIQLEECQVGDILSRHVVDLNTGAILLSAGHILVSDNIKWLEKFPCSDFYIYVDSCSKIWNLGNEEIIAYEENNKKVQDILEEVGEGKGIDQDSLKEVKDTFFEKLNNNSTIMGCVSKVKGVDEYTYVHCMNVGMLSVIIGKWMKLGEKELQSLFLAGVLHDVGKYKIDIDLLNKKEELAIEERELLQRHVIYSYQITKELKELNNEVLSGILYHHERLDGSGYPGGLKGNQIGLFSRIIAIADTYDAMISERAYKPKSTPFEVMEKMTQEGFGKLDMEILMLFLKNISSYYIGVKVVLNTGEVGEVVFIHPQCVHRPIVQVDNKYVDLNSRSQIKIVNMV